PYNQATEDHVRLYRKWSEGGCGLLLSGNIQIDRRSMERPGNIAVDNNGALDMLARMTAAGTEAGNHFWAQISHGGRQSPASICPDPVAPSAVSLENFQKDKFNPPREITVDEIEDFIGRFAHVAGVCKDAGFTGVQLHSAHGYLLSSFLSPVTNQRTDEWGGSLENRTRFLRRALEAVRARVGPDFPISVKINSADFQKGGFDEGDALQVFGWLGEWGVDLIEVSGGTYEEPTVLYGDTDPMGRPIRESTKKREAYFLEFAEKARAATKAPLMVTGGFRSAAVMNEALTSGDLDVVGIARPLCTQPDAANALLSGSADRIDDHEKRLMPITAEDLGGPDVPEIAVREANLFADLGWFCLQIIYLGQDKPLQPGLAPLQALQDYVAYETDKTVNWSGPAGNPTGSAAAE
ncbi:MAG: NADH:flavin oxidoreductase/NADH oxidase family protein, partial [Pseudomonadota bacterium]